ncbi:uncharacterized protein LOC107219088 [Neodiprion lecontei]|uniref:Uncharacterized protein LOC107219088 n=1 Tax=Neodiprion lecontei TaxID=441921 RepID=A0A6J0BE52_NEOLC|nr:uncharacterized protein LOC107219088 [Neodiprion lecontei]
MAIIEPEMINQNIRSDHSESSRFSNSKETYNGTVRVAASYDMGYSTKRSGRTYDSMNGYAAFLGRENGKAIDYLTTNRGCRMCALGHPKSDHDCRLNFVGSAKAMEPFAAASMTSSSKIFKEHNIEVGILIGDDDSSTIAAVRATSQSQTTSGDFRFACAIGEKNLGERYLQEAATKRLLSPGFHTTKYVGRKEKEAKRRYLRTKRPEFKKRRLFLKEQCTNLRKKKEDMEGIQYESNMGLLSTNVAHDSILNTEGINEEINEADDNGTQVSEPIAVFFDLETSSFSKQSDILQIAAQYDKSFSVYVNPTQKIAAQASEANGLTNVRGKLMLNGTRVPSIPLRLALDAFHNFLTKLKHPVVLVAHNCKFDAPILINSVKKMTMTDDFGSVVVGFADTLPLIKSVTNRKGKGECTLTGLASWLQISADGAHNAVYDVLMLVQIIENLQITTKQLMDRSITWSDTIASIHNAKKSATLLKTLDKLGTCISTGMKKKIANADITYEDLINTFRDDGDAGIKKLLGKDENDKVRVTKTKTIIENLLNHLRTKGL